MEHENEEAAKAMRERCVAIVKRMEKKERFLHTFPAHDDLSSMGSSIRVEETTMWLTRYPTLKETIDRIYALPLIESK
jgi:hypothetical protein